MILQSTAHAAAQEYAPDVCPCLFALLGLEGPLAGLLRLPVRPAH